MSLVVDKNGAMVDSDKVSVIRDSQYAFITNKTELKSFLGLAFYYWRFIKGFSKIAQPLHEMTSDKIAFEWTSDMQIAFDTLRQRLCEPSVLAYADLE